MESDLAATFTTNTRVDNGDAMPDQAGGEMVGAGTSEMSIDEGKNSFLHFITHFCRTSGGDFIYAEQLRSNTKVGTFILEVDMNDLIMYSEHLATAIQKSPSRIIPHLEGVATKLARDWMTADARAVLAEAQAREAQGARGEVLPLGLQLKNDIQLQIFWSVAPLPLRELVLEEVSRLVVVAGIVVKAGPTSVKCVRATIQCTSCRSKTIVSGGQSSDLPNQCMQNDGGEGGRSNKCRPNPYVLLPDQCEFEDGQSVKVQELPEDVPTGELPRNISVVMDRYLVDKIPPGSRAHIVGIVSVSDKRNKANKRGAAGVRSQFLRCVGVMLVSGGSAGQVSVESVNRQFSSRIRSRTRANWQPEDEHEFKNFAKRNPYKVISEAIDPAVFGLVDQKRAVAALLFGGTRKTLDGNYLRGDMNVLLVGDPSTAKSQLLKFVEKIAPIGIYTSGKGASAAGLTASVVGSGGDFSLEAGSMVLADGGVCCIDEFDKMRDQDQVAIHEAMEQQTISIAKANLTTMLNSRTSVLAAANPTLGNYDPSLTNEQQMNFAGSILSRFDLIFKVLDPKDIDRDKKLADHVVKIHKSQIKRVSTASTKQGLAFLTKFIAYARATTRPQISAAARDELLDYFVKVRKDSHQQTLASRAGGSTGSSAGKEGAQIIQVTARQLESLVRITECLAKMRLDTVASIDDAKEAIRLFRVSTVDAINSGIVEHAMNEAQGEVVLKIEDAIRRRVMVGAKVLHKDLMAELGRMGFDRRMGDAALSAMTRRDEIEWKDQRTRLYRAK